MYIYIYICHGRKSKLQKITAVSIKQHDFSGSMKYSAFNLKKKRGGIIQRNLESHKQK
jgi:hypothetical protein